MAELQSTGSIHIPKITSDRLASGQRAYKIAQTPITTITEPESAAEFQSFAYYGAGADLLGGSTVNMWTYPIDVIINKQGEPSRYTNLTIIYMYGFGMQVAGSEAQSFSEVQGIINQTDADGNKVTTLTIAEQYVNTLAEAQWLSKVFGVTFQTVSGEGFNTESKVITSNGEYTPSTGIDGFDRVEVNVSAPAPTLQEKTATQNGIFTADEGYDGLSQVTVDVDAITDIATASEMDALLVETNVGKIYRFTGTTDSKYINGDLYEVEQLGGVMATQ